MQYLIIIMMCKSSSRVGVGHCWLILPTLQILSHVITGFFSRVKEHLRGKQLKSEDDNTAATASLCCLTKDEYSAAVDHLPYRWEKCFNSAGDYIGYRTCVNIQEYQ
jgi:hypothetical protein